MSWIYESSSGSLLYSVDGSLAGTLVGKGYSGKKGYKNKVMYDHLKDTGPIPPGTYTIGLAYHSRTKGSITMDLNPLGHYAFGRTLFRIHGNNIKNDASEGCIILGPDIRKQVSESSDRVLVVVRKLEAADSPLQKRLRHIIKERPGVAT